MLQCWDAAVEESGTTSCSGIAMLLTDLDLACKMLGLLVLALLLVLLLVLFPLLRMLCGAVGGSG